MGNMLSVHHSFNYTPYDEVYTIFNQRIKNEFLFLLEENKFSLRYLLPNSFEFDVVEYHSILQKFGIPYGDLMQMFIVTNSFILMPHIVGISNNVISATFSVYFNKETFFDSMLKDISNIIDKYKVNNHVISIDWAISTREGIRYYDVKSLFDEIIYQEAYPYLDNIETYVNNFLKSKENVLLIVGTPGTGKTRFIKYIIQTMAETTTKEIKLLYSMDAKAFAEDDFFLRFLTTDYTALVLEDIDINLQSRRNGNTFMTKLLSGSDGLIKNSKKIIMSTNLSNVNDIDEALLRPGRMFDLLRTRKLSYEEACVLSKKLNNNDLNKLKDTDKISLAEIYNCK